MNNNPLLYKGLIWCFGALYALVAFISFWHCIAFCLVGNPIWISVMMSFAFEVGLAATLFSVLTTDNKNNYVAWVLMTFLTGVQVIGNVYSVYKYMVESGTKFYTYIQDSMLHWFVEDVPTNEIMSIIAIILGALLPIVALLMTAMVSNNLKIWLNKRSNEAPAPIVIPDNEYSNKSEMPEAGEDENGFTPPEEDKSDTSQEESKDIKLDNKTLQERKEFYDYIDELRENENNTVESQQEPANEEENLKDENSDVKSEGEKVLNGEEYPLFDDPSAGFQDDYNLDFAEEDRSSDKPIQDAVVDNPVADVSILDIDNAPARESATETLNPIPKHAEPDWNKVEKHPLKGIVDDGEAVEIRNTTDPRFVGNSGKHSVQDHPQDSSIIDPSPLTDTIKKNVEVIQQKAGPFSLFKPGN